MYKHLNSKFLINSHFRKKVKQTILFYLLRRLSDSMYKVLRLSPEYDSFIFKFEKNTPKPAYFTPPIEGTYKINRHNTHFDSLEVVNALNECLHFFFEKKRRK